MAEKKTTKKKPARKKAAKKKEEPAEKKEAKEEKAGAKEEKAAEKKEKAEEKAPKKEERAAATKMEEKRDEPKAPKKAKKKKKGKKKTKVEHARGKRKRAIARATVKEGSGKVRINAKLLGSFGNKYMQKIIGEPVEIAGPEALTVDVEVHVMGGGAMGQAQACRTAIARALAQWFGEGLKKKYKESDRYLLREDPRRVEPKKYKGPKARARFQKSYR